MAKKAEEGEQYAGSVDSEGYRVTQKDNPCPPEMMASTRPLKSKIAGALINIPDLPPHYLERTELLETVKTRLLSENTHIIALVGASRKTGTQGMGGVGKSVLATALAHDDVVRRYFPDGILWLCIGRTADDARVVSLQEQIVHSLTDAHEVFSSLQEGKARLKQMLACKACLIVVDDVWDCQHVDALDVLGEEGRLIITTRDSEVSTRYRPHAISVDILDADTALAFLAAWAGQTIEDLPSEANDIIRECGNLPLALAMIGGMKHITKESWHNILHRLRAISTVKIRQDYSGYPYPEMIRAIQLCVDNLPQAISSRYLDLAIVTEDSWIPGSLLDGFWQAAGLESKNTSILIKALLNCALLRQTTPAGRTGEKYYSLHDLQLDYLRRQGREMVTLHTYIVEAYRKICSNNWLEGSDDGYFFQRLPYHLKEAGRLDELHGLLLDFNWMRQKLHAVGLNALIADFDLALNATVNFTEAEEAGAIITPKYVKGEGDEGLRLVQDALRLAAPVVMRDPLQLAGQLRGRLLAVDQPGTRMLLHSIEVGQDKPWFSPLAATLTAPGGFVDNSGYSDRINAVALAADGRRAISGSHRGEIRVWDIETGGQIRRLDGHVSTILSIAMTADGRRAVSGSADGILKVWDVENGSLLRTLAGHSGRVLAVALSLDGRRIVSSSWDGALKLWDADTGRLVRVFDNHASDVTSVALSADGQRLVSGSYDGTLRVWEIKSGTAVHTLKGHSEAVLSVALSADGKCAITGSEDGLLKVWNVEKGLLLQTFEGHTSMVNAVGLTTDGKFAVSASADHTLKVWNVYNGSLVRNLKGHKGTVGAVAISVDGQHVVSASEDNTMKVWEVKRGRPLRNLVGHDGEVYEIVLSMNGKRAASRSEDHMLKLWDVEHGRLMHILEGQKGSVNTIALTPDGRRVFSGSVDGILKVWDVETGSLLRRFEGHKKAVNIIAVSPNASRAVSGSADNTLIVWDVESGRLIYTLDGHTDMVVALGLSSDGRRAISGSWDHTLKMWNLENGRLLGTLEGHDGIISALALSANGRRVASGSDDCTIKVWDLERARLLRNFEGHTEKIHAVILSKDGRQVVSASWDRSLKVWDVETGQMLRSIEGHRGAIAAIPMTPDETHALTGCEDGTLRLWNIKNGDCLATFTADGSLYCCNVSADGKTFAAGDSLGRVHFLRLQGR